MNLLILPIFNRAVSLYTHTRTHGALIKQPERREKKTVHTASIAFISNNMEHWNSYTKN